MSDFLIQAQMHAECLNEALCELFIKSPSEDRKKVIEAEMAARVWAVIYQTAKRRPQGVRLSARLDGTR